jgi:hypothetical protein
MKRTSAENGSFGNTQSKMGGRNIVTKPRLALRQVDVNAE